MTFKRIFHRATWRLIRAGYRVDVAVHNLRKLHAAGISPPDMAFFKAQDAYHNAEAEWDRLVKEYAETYKKRPS